MNDYFVKEGKDTPLIEFKKNGVFLMTGRSIPGDADEFYLPVIRYLENVKQDIEFIFKLVYYNTSSMRYIHTILSILETINKNYKVLVFWHYDENDDVMEEIGKDMKSDYKMDVKLIKIKDIRKRWKIF
jgi:hypothetical protein